MKSYMTRNSICFTKKRRTCMDLFTQGISDLEKVRLFKCLPAFVLGLALVYARYLQSGYGHCPRALCDKQRVIPNGMSDKPNQNRVKVYCPKCEELYVPETSGSLDGSCFGTSLAHLFFQAYSKQLEFPPKLYLFEPTLHGFKIAGKRGSKYFKPT